MCCPNLDYNIPVKYKKKWPALRGAGQLGLKPVSYPIALCQALLDTHIYSSTNIILLILCFIKQNLWIQKIMLNLDKQIC